MHNPKVSVGAGGERFSRTARVVEKDPLVAEIKKLMKKKYGWDDGLIVELARS